MFEKMSLAQFQREFPDGLPVKVSSKRKAGTRATSIQDLRSSPPEPEEKKRSKYGNKPTKIDDLKFDSQRESDRYAELCLLLRLGEIERLELQPKYVLADEVQLEGELRCKKPLVYIADFTYYCKKRNKQIIEDVKSEATAKCKAYRIKKHLMKAYLGLDVTEIKYS